MPHTKVALITGSANNIGRGIALARDGDRSMVTARLARGKRGDGAAGGRGGVGGRGASGRSPTRRRRVAGRLGSRTRAARCAGEQRLGPPADQVGRDQRRGVALDPAEMAVRRDPIIRTCPSLGRRYSGFAMPVAFSPRVRDGTFTRFHTGMDHRAPSRIAASAAIAGCRMKRNRIGQLGRSTRSLQKRSKVAAVNPCHSAPATISAMAMTMTSLARTSQSLRLCVERHTTAPA